MTGSWLSGPSAALPPPDPTKQDSYRGESLGLPPTGPGSLVGMGRRVLAMFVDWLIAYGLAALILGGLDTRIGEVTLAIWFVFGVATVTLFGFTPGQYFTKIMVVRIDAPVRVGFLRALARSALLVFVVPALFADSAGRGMHDRATGTAIVRSR